MKGAPRRILGIDPGVATTGWGVIDCQGKDRVAVVHYGSIITVSKDARGERLLSIFHELSTVIKKYAPQEAAVEELFFNRNVKTALSVGEARGVALLCATFHGIQVYEYTPLEVKQAIVGYGRATKYQVSYMVGQILGIEKPITPDDTADALAVALCHAFCRDLRDGNKC